MAKARQASPMDAQRRFVFLRLRFNAVLSQLDLFHQVITQRSESEQGVWLSGLDVVAADALALPEYYEAPPVICYLDRGVGGAIRRARTRLPGGGENPVAVIRVPRERMIGSGIASSLIHEVGHQGRGPAGLVPSLRAGSARQATRRKQALGMASVGALDLRNRFRFLVGRAAGRGIDLGLIGVVSLPRPFVFRINVDDPHPTPWIRVKLSCAIGDGLYPHPQWQRVASLWESYYPLADLDDKRRDLLAMLQESLPEFVAVLVNHRPKTLHGRSLLEAMKIEQRTPARLTALFGAWSQGAEADVSRATIAGFRCAGPSESGR